VSHRKGRRTAAGRGTPAPKSVARWRLAAAVGLLAASCTTDRDASAPQPIREAAAPAGATLWDRVSVGPDGRTLTVHFQSQSCAEGDVTATEKAEAVVVTAALRPQGSVSSNRCSTLGVPSTSTLVLESPLGDRAVVDGGCSAVDFAELQRCRQPDQGRLRRLAPNTCADEQHRLTAVSEPTRHSIKVTFSAEPASPAECHLHLAFTVEVRDEGGKIIELQGNPSTGVVDGDIQQRPRSVWFVEGMCDAPSKVTVAFVAPTATATSPLVPSESCTGGSRRALVAAEPLP